MTRSRLTRAARRRRARSRARSRALLLGGMLVAVVAGLFTWRVVSDRGSRPADKDASGPTPARANGRPAARGSKPVPLRLDERRVALLPAATQDEAAASLGGGRVMLLGGLTAADTSSNAIVIATAGGA